MFCPHCRCYNDDGRTVCDRCGKPLVDPDDVPKTDVLADTTDDFNETVVEYESTESLHAFLFGGMRDETAARKNAANLRSGNAPGRDVSRQATPSNKAYPTQAPTEFISPMSPQSNDNPPTIIGNPAFASGAKASAPYTPPPSQTTARPTAYTTPAAPPVPPVPPPPAQVKPERMRSWRIPLIAGGSAVAVIAVAAALIFAFSGEPTREAGVPDRTAVAESDAPYGESEGTSSYEGATDYGSDSADTGATQQTYGGGGSSSSNAYTPETPDYAGEDAHESSGGSGGKSPFTGGLGENEAYDILCEHYDKIGSFDSKIENCATDFNETYLDKSIEKRKRLAAKAESLMSQIESSARDLSGIKLPYRSINVDALEDLEELYDLLYDRIAVIVEAWDISLEYEDPTGHDKEIIEPLKDAQDSTGHNRAYTEFKKLYPEVEIKQPSTGNGPKAL